MDWTRDELGDDVRRLLPAFYAAADPCAADLIAKQIVARMKPPLNRWAAQATRQLADPMLDAEDFCVDAQEKLWEALHKSRNATSITDVFAYAKVIVLRLLLIQLRSRRKERNQGCEPLEDMADPGSHIEALLAQENARHICRLAWKALAQCRLNGRRALLLARTRDHIHLWIGLPNACPELALMLEMEEAETRELWKRLPLDEQEIAERLKTSVAYVQKLRSLTRAEMWRLVFEDKDMEQ